MRRTIVLFAALGGLAACTATAPEPPAHGLTENAREWVEAERAKDRDVCRAGNETGSDAYRDCLARRGEVRRERLRALQDWFRMRRLGAGRSDCVDPFTGQTTVCLEI